MWPVCVCQTPMWRFTLITTHLQWWLDDIRKGKQRIKTKSFPSENQSQLVGVGLQPAERHSAMLPPSHPACRGCEMNKLAKNTSSPTHLLGLSAGVSLWEIQLMIFTSLLMEETQPACVAPAPVSFISACVASMALLRLVLKQYVLRCSKCYPGTALRN